MIKVFTKQIRLKLLGGGNLKKYSLYAIGEIMLIVISISLAWKINDWNSTRNERINEIQILADLSKDFNANIRALDSSIALYPESTQRLKSALNYIGLEPNLISTEMKDTIISVNQTNTEIVDGTVNAILSSDILEMIGNDSLMSVISAYQAHVATFKSHEKELEHVVINKHRPVLERYLSLTDLLSDKDSTFQIIKNKSVKSDYYKLLNSLEYQNVLIDRLNMENNLLISAKKFKSQTEEVLEMLNRELKSY